MFYYIRFLGMREEFYYLFFFDVDGSEKVKWFEDLRINKVFMRIDDVFENLENENKIEDDGNEKEVEESDGFLLWFEILEIGENSVENENIKDEE